MGVVVVRGWGDNLLLLLLLDGGGVGRWWWVAEWVRCGGHKLLMNFIDHCVMAYFDQGAFTERVPAGATTRGVGWTRAERVAVTEKTATPGRIECILVLKCRL